MLKTAGIAVALMLLTAGCMANDPRPDSPAAYEPCPCRKKALTLAPMSVSVSDLLENPRQYNGRIVYVTGRFMGWKGHCRGGPPVTRRDWMLEDKDACIYVSGPLPSGISNARAGKTMGKSIWVRGNIRLDGNGIPYIKKSGKK